MKDLPLTFLNKNEIIKFLFKVDSAEKAQDLITLIENGVFSETLPSYMGELLLHRNMVLKHWKEGKEYQYLGIGLDATTGETQVYYAEPDGSMIYNRTQEEMFKLIENYQGEMVPRFITKERTDNDKQQ